MPLARHLLLDVGGLDPPDPLVRVLSALEELRPNERRNVVVDLEPRPLYTILENNGYLYQAQATSEDVFEILIWRGSAPK